MYKFYYTNGYGVTSYIRKSIVTYGKQHGNPNISKWLMRINLTCLILLIAFMQVSLAANAQKISLSKNNAPLTEIFRELKKQSGYGFMINREQAKMAKPVTISATGDDLEKVLDKCFEGQPFTYKLEGKMIVVIDGKPTQVKMDTRKIDVKGRLVNESGGAMAGASVSIKGTDSRTVSNDNGEFSFINVDESAILIISFIGYEVKEISVKADLSNITMNVSTAKLDEVSVNTGYQKLSKERLTGSVVKIDNNLLERRVSTNILNRLEDVVPGLVFNRSGLSSKKSPISIRGQSTIFGNTDPLIILNNFPYDGDLNNINPNDVEDITVLKDAAAASIWGARAGNGVIVITTKQGIANSTAKINFSSRLTIGDKPDLLNTRIMGSADYIETEKRLFAANFYRSTEQSAARAPLSPVIELLIAKRDGQLNPLIADATIESMKQLDVRQQYLQYLYRNPLSMQQSLGVSGGSQSSKYYLSAGWDKNLETLKANSFNRITITANNSYMFLKDRLEFSANVNFNQNKNILNNSGTTNIMLSSLGGIYPYAQLADADGNALAIASNYRLSYMQSAEQKGLLDWTNRPLDEIRFADNSTMYRELRGDFALSYKIFAGLKAKILYQRIYGNSISRNHKSQQTYSTRNLINTYSIINPNGSMTRPIPLGGILDQTDALINTDQLRAQVSYDRTLGALHNLSFLGGYEFKDAGTEVRNFRIYGYDDIHATGQLVDYQKSYTSQVTPANNFLIIPNGDSMSSLTDRFVSYYANGAYTFRNRYNLYASARLDQSNIFGVNTNQKGIPLWSAGASWNIKNEDFFKLKDVDLLKLRLSFGYNGNVDKTLSAYTTALYYAGSTSETGLPLAEIQNPPNPELRWERFSILNAGIDFAVFKSRLTGSVDIYSKRGMDLLGSTPFAPSTGITLFRGNYADTKGRGIDLNLHSSNIRSVISWQTDLLFSFAQDRVTNYEVKATNSNYLEQGVNGSFPLLGKPLYGIYSYQWAGLDPLNGDPMGYLGNVVSKDYAKIQTTTPLSDLVYHGSSRPLVFGALRNTISYKGLDLSANISYRFSYYFRKQSIRYIGNQGLGGHSDYTLRWQKPGDEINTIVPSISVTNNARRDNFYTYSEVLVSKGDHIRFQDINLSYNFGSRFSDIGIKGLKMFLYVDNIGLIWKATDFDVDPDYQLMRSARTYALGININL